MYNSKVLALAAVGCVFAAGSLRAQSGTATMQLIGAADPNSSCYATSSGGANENCFSAAPYYAQFTNVVNNTGVLLPPGGSPWGPQWDVYCTDYFHDAFVYQPQSYYLNNMSDLAGAHSAWLGVYTRWTNMTDYLGAAWLSEQLKNYAVGSEQAQEISGAIWQVMQNGAYTLYHYVGGGWDPNYLGTGIGYWAGQALLASNYNTVNKSEWVVVTPTDFRETGSTQSFITQVTPEPATMLLLGTGLLVMMFGAGAARRLSA